MMFADDILRDRAAGLVLGASGVQQLSSVLGEATRFVLDPQFTEAADALYCDKDQLIKMLPFCATPFDTVWFEFPAQRRTSWEAPNHSPPKRSAGLNNEDLARVGYLFERPSSIASQTVALFWQDLTGRCFFSPYTITYDDVLMISAQSVGPAERGFRTRTRFAVPPWAINYLELCARNGEADAAFEVAPHDWKGEVHFIFAILALLNTRNVAERSFTDKSEFNRKRVRIGKPPLFSHYTLKVSPRTAAQIKEASGHESIAPGSVRSHFVRGHWKHCRTGIYFWHPYRRGNPNVGHIVKDYELT